MNKIQIKRLEKLATHLEKGKLGHKTFDFEEVNSGPLDIKGCGTLGCAIGEMPFVHPNSWHFNRQGDLTKTSNGSCIAIEVELWYGINHAECAHLFYPYGQQPEIYGGKQLGSDPTRKKVAKNIRAFLKIKTSCNKK